MKKRIFTFWEPKNNLPPYLELCMQTWKKFLPDYEIILLDYSNLSDWIDFCADDIFRQNFSLPKQADAIRCFLLEKYGGLWLDVDTIITDNKINEILTIDSNLILIGDHIGFINAKPKSFILIEWKIELENRIKIAKEFYANPFKIFKRKLFRKIKSYDYLGNGIINNIISKSQAQEYFSINEKEINAFPELNLEKISRLKNTKKYRYFYFENDFSDVVLKNNGGIICLHNSWTPKEYKQMDKETFFAKNNTLSNILKKILN